MLCEFANFVRSEKFNIVIGYNIMGFDFKYMMNRAIYRQCKDEFIHWGCLIETNEKIYEMSYSFKWIWYEKYLYNQKRMDF